jgi:prepilin-type N-terminal cleavage/methylation domain-containing protein
MGNLRRPANGYSLIELLVILSIVGILAVAGATLLQGNRVSGSVRTVMDDLEGTLMAGQKLAAATGQDVMMATQGEWQASSTPLILAMNSTVGVTPAQVVAAGVTDPASFKVGVQNGGGLVREHLHAGVATAAHQQTWWATAAQATPSGRQNEDPASIEPFKSTQAFKDLLGNTGNNLFQGVSAASDFSKGSQTPGTLVVSGTSKRFMSGRIILVVGLRGGFSFPGAPMGMLVVLANGSTVYKFYNPGAAEGDGRWRKI